MAFLCKLCKHNTFLQGKLQSLQDLQACKSWLLHCTVLQASNRVWCCRCHTTCGVTGVTPHVVSQALHRMVSWVLHHVVSQALHHMVSQVLHRMVSWALHHMVSHALHGVVGIVPHGVTGIIPCIATSVTPHVVS
jgi:hypothetical protein